MKKRKLQIALPLEFDDVSSSITSRAEAISSIEWSYSKRDILHQCPLRYYFSYYGSNKRRAKGDERKNRLIELKNMENRYLRSGSLLHVAISLYFSTTKNGNPMTLLQLIDWIRRKFQSDIIFSRTGKTPRNFNPKYPPCLLREYVYERDVADELCLDAEERMIDALTAFYNDPLFEEFRKAGTQADSIVEQTIRPRTLPCRVIGRVDLAFSVGQHAVVVDWKSGTSDAFGDDSLQLAIYGLWAVDHFKCEPADLKVYKAFLSSRELVSFPITTAILNDARIRIIQDAERMATLDTYGQAGVHEAFTPRLLKNVCRLCEYEAICYA